MTAQIPPLKLLPLLAKLGDYFKLGLEYYILLKTQGKEIGPDGVALFIASKMEDWNPEVLGRKALDKDTKAAAARMLAGVAVNLSSD